MKYFFAIFNTILAGLIVLIICIKPDIKDITAKINNKSLNTSSFSESIIQLKKEIEKEKAEKEILETQVGNMSAYGPDCSGCTGRLASGYNASGGNYYYNDSKYGEVRIVAGDKSYPFGTIVRIKSDNFDTFNAIVLDRGGGIGFNKRYLFDLLCPSEANALNVGSLKNVTFEILRYGY